MILLSRPFSSAWHDLCIVCHCSKKEEHDAFDDDEERLVRNAYIKFHTDTETDYAEVCEALVEHSSVSRLSNGVFCVPWGSLALLDAREVAYTFASESDLTDAQPIWNFASPKT
jgi:hypothetical protein